jgi:hypothetical protein
MAVAFWLDKKFDARVFADRRIVCGIDSADVLFACEEVDVYRFAGVGDVKCCKGTVGELRLPVERVDVSASTFAVKDACQLVGVCR